MNFLLIESSVAVEADAGGHISSKETVLTLCCCSRLEKAAPFFRSLIATTSASLPLYLANEGASFWVSSAGVRLLRWKALIKGYSKT